jgi:mannose-6-phosphate isomerase
MPPLTLFRFKPILRRYLWGGRRLAELGKTLGAGEDYAESWEVVDHGVDQSIVAEGPLAGTALNQLVRQHGDLLFGRHHPQAQFPLLFKFLDCQRTLSVQVHPNDEQAAKLEPPDLGKTEAWLVLAAEPGSRIYAGLKPGVNRAQLAGAIQAGNCEACLHQFEPKVGDCVFIKAGTVHALGAGLLVAEIQQSSDTTFRLFDWDRVDRDGKPRQLHVEQSLSVIDFSRGPICPQPPRPTPQQYVNRLVESDKFVLDRWQFTESQTLTNDNRAHILAVVDGELSAASGDSMHRLGRGDTLLLPACCSAVELTPIGHASLLDIYLP